MRVNWYLQSFFAKMLHLDITISRIRMIHEVATQQAYEEGLITNGDRLATQRSCGHSDATVKAYYMPANRQRDASKAAQASASITGWRDKVRGVDDRDIDSHRDRDSDSDHDHDHDHDSDSDRGRRDRCHDHDSDSDRDRRDRYHDHDHDRDSDHGRRNRDRDSDNRDGVRDRRDRDRDMVCSLRDRDRYTDTDWGRSKRHRVCSNDVDDAYDQHTGTISAS